MSPIIYARPGIISRNYLQLCATRPPHTSVSSYIYISIYLQQLYNSVVACCIWKLCKIDTISSADLPLTPHRPLLATWPTPAPPGWPPDSRLVLVGWWHTWGGASLAVSRVSQHCRLSHLHTSQQWARDADHLIRIRMVERRESKASSELMKYNKQFVMCILYRMC